MNIIHCNMILIHKSSHTFLYQVLVSTGIQPYSDIFLPLNDIVFPTTARNAKLNVS